MKSGVDISVFPSGFLAILKHAGFRIMALAALCCFFTWFVLSRDISWPVLTGGNAVALSLAILLMPCNLLAEAKKLHFKLGPSIPLHACLGMVCKGFAMDLFMPLGLGSYAGRGWMQRESERAEIVELTLAGSLAQNLCNLAFGILLTLSLLPKGTAWVPGNGMPMVAWSLLVLIALAGLLFYCIRKEWPKPVFAFLKRWSWKPKGMNLRDVLTISGYAALRYAAYLLQYLLLLSLFPAVDVASAAGYAGLYLMLASLVVWPGSLAVYGRGAMSAWVFQMAGMSPTEAISASGFILLLNAVLPAMFGFYLLLNHSIRQAKC